MSKRPRDILLATIVTFSVALSLLCPVTAIADETAAGETSNEETRWNYGPQPSYGSVQSYLEWL